MKKLLSIMLISILSILLLPACTRINNANETTTIETNDQTQETTMFEDLDGLLSETSSKKLTKENCAKVKVGMTYSEVVEIIGKPQEFTQLPHSKGLYWNSNECHLLVCIGFSIDNAALSSTSDNIKNYGIITAIPQEYIPN